MTCGKILTAAFGFLAAAWMYDITASITGTMVSATIALLFGLPGSLGPDLDHHNSYIYRTFRGATTIVAVIVIFYLQYQGWDIMLAISKALIDVTTVIELAPSRLSYIMAGLTAFIGAAAVFELIEVLRPGHGGVLHTVKAHITFAGIMIPVLHHIFVSASIPMPWAQATIAATSWVLNATLHILIDKIHRLLL